MTKTWKERISEEGRYTEGWKEQEKKRERERPRGSSDGDQKQGLNINAARLRDFRAAVHQNLGERATIISWAARGRSTNRARTSAPSPIQGDHCSTHMHLTASGDPPHLDFLFDFT